jgi:hypothetical protein
VRPDDEPAWGAEEPSVDLPTSDLSHALHRYVSQFMAQPHVERNHLQYKSMDMTALLAMSILIDEAVKAEVEKGNTGYLAFLEGDDEDGIVQRESWWNGSKWVRSVLEPGAWEKRRRTRRRNQEEEVAVSGAGSEESDSEPLVKMHKHNKQVELVLSPERQGRGGPARAAKRETITKTVRKEKSVGGFEPTSNRRRRRRAKPIPMSAEFVVDSSDEMKEEDDEQDHITTNNLSTSQQELIEQNNELEGLELSSSRLQQPTQVRMGSILDELEEPNAESSDAMEDESDNRSIIEPSAKHVRRTTRSLSGVPLSTGTGGDSEEIESDDSELEVKLQNDMSDDDEDSENVGERQIVSNINDTESTDGLSTENDESEEGNSSEDSFDGDDPDEVDTD